MSGLGFTQAVFDGCLPGFERVVREYINHLWWLLIEGNGVSQPAARNKVQRRRGDGFHRGGSRIEEIHFIFEAGRRLLRPKGGFQWGDRCPGAPSSALVLRFFPATRWRCRTCALIICLALCKNLFVPQAP